MTEMNNPKVSSERNHPKTQLRKWWKRLKVWTFVLNIATFFAVVVYAVITAEMWIQMREQTKTANRQLILSERPWISVDVRLGDLKLAEPWTSPLGGGLFNGAIVLKNVGHSPAVRVHYDFTMLVHPHVGEPVWAEPQKVQKEICERLRTAKEGDPTWGYSILFADQESAPLTLIAGVSQEMIGAYPNFTPLLIGCVDYRSTFDTTTHQTGFMYYIGRYFPLDGKTLHGIAVGTTLKSDQILVLPYAEEGFFAD